MRSADTHLTPPEFESLLFPGADENADDGRMATQEAQQHLDGCAVCQAMAKKYVHADSVFRALGVPPSDRSRSRRADCPPEETWLLLAAGLIGDAAAAQYVSHAARCDWCGPLLKESMEDLAQPVTVEEEAALANLESASPEWQQDLGKKLAAASAERSRPAAPAHKKSPPKDEKRRFVWWPKLAAAAACALVAIGGWQIWERTRLTYAERLLAEAYTEHRTIELRMPGAAYGGMRVERGDSAPKMPVQFDEAQVIIKRESKKHPDDPGWLQAEARAALLQWEYTDALKELGDALALKPGDPGLLRDEATAFFERARKNGDQASVDYSNAAEDLTKALKKNPSDPIALFNRAVVYDTMGLPDKAITDLDRYLTIEPSGGWSREAQERKQKNEKLIHSHDSSRAEPLAKPIFFVDLASDGAAASQLHLRIEEYQDRAILDWLPGAFVPETPAGQRAEHLVALRTLGMLLESDHHDAWLNDLLAEANDSPAFVAGLRALGVAVSHSSTRDAETAFAGASQAVHFFAIVGNRAGTLRAQQEQVHALRNRQDGKRCLAQARSLARQLRGRKYAWLEGQLDTDMASCFLMTRDFDRAQEYATRAAKISSDAGYKNLQLRTIGLMAAVQTDEGDIAAAWAQDQHGIAEFWAHPYAPAIRAQQFYDDLTYLAENNDEPGLAVTLAQESARMTSLAGDKNLEALSRQHLAKIALQDGDLAVAADELEKSSNLLKALSNHAGRLYAQIGLAEIDLRQGRLISAETTLRSLRNQVDAVDPFTVKRAFFKVYGELLARQGQLEEAEIAYHRAIRIADSSLKKLATPAQRYFWMLENAELYRGLVQLELKKDDTARALAVWEWYRAASAGPSSLPWESLSSFLAGDGLSSERASLREETVVSYFLLPAGLRIWIFDERGIRSKFVAVDPLRLAALIRRFVEMCADDHSDISLLQTAGRALHEILFDPVEDLLDAERLIVVEPDEIIGDLPFGALVARGGRYLGETRRIVLSPGLLYTRLLRPAGALSPDARVLVIGSTASFAGSGAALVPDSDALGEAKMVSAMFPHAKSLSDLTATVKEMERLLPGSDSLHFAGHAVSTADNEGLVMLAGRSPSETTLWGADAVQPNIFRHLRLAVLSACSTGRSYRGRREVRGGLVRALILAGVPSVVGTRWNVDSHATKGFMKPFYDALVSGQSVSSAIQAAQAALISNPETRHPYFWASFAVFGRA